jgi:hypothetical protein
MKKFVFAALAVLGLVLGTVSLTTPGNATYVHTSDNPNQDVG